MLLCFGTMFASQVSDQYCWFCFLFHRHWSKWRYLIVFILIFMFYPRIVVGCCRFLAWLNSVWKMERNKLGMQPVSVIYVWGYWLDWRWLYYLLSVNITCSFYLSNTQCTVFLQNLLSHHHEPLGMEILTAAQAIFQVLLSLLTANFKDYGVFFFFFFSLLRRK